MDLLSIGVISDLYISTGIGMKETPHIFYRYPLPDDVEIQMHQPEGEYAHENFPESRYAIDFLVDIGTPVVAVEKGKVVLVKSDFDEWGLDKELAEKANLVALKHEGNVYTEYLHLGKDKVAVQEGQEVEAGDILGYTGYSGCMSAPHLHLNAFKVESGKGVSIPVEFNVKEK